MDERPHKVMTPEEYAAWNIKGWHRVCKDVDGCGSVGVIFEPQPPAAQRDMDAPICILRMAGEITGWIIATDVHDARRKAHYTGQQDIAAKLYRIEFPSPGKHDLGGGYVMLVG